MKRDLAFSAEAAERYGVDGAVMLHHLAFWVFRNKLNGDNEVDGHVWTWNSARAFAGLFTFWTQDQIRRVLRNLEKDGAILSGQHNRRGYDRTKWYTLTQEALDLYHFDKRPNASGQSPTSKLVKPKMDVAKPQDLYQITTQVPTQMLYPWEDDAFKQVWELWKKDRRERGIRKYTERGEQGALHKLSKESNGDLGVAIEMINQSIANGYQGIFKLDNKQKVSGLKPDADTFVAWANRDEG